MAKRSKAIKPDKVFPNLPIFLKEKEVKPESLADEEKILGQGGKTAFWGVLKDFIEEVVKELDEVNDLAISQGGSYEEIGKNTIVISTTKGIIKKIIDKVEDSKEALDQQTTGRTSQ